MWRIYNSNHDSVRIQSTVGLLHRGILSAVTGSHPNFVDHATDHLFIGEVKYHSKNALERIISNTRFGEVAVTGRGRPWAALVLLKRDDFSHEKEVRLLYQKSNNATFSDLTYFSGRHYREFISNGESVFQEAFIHLPFDWTNTISSVMIGPQASDDSEKSIKRKLLHVFSRIKIEKSTMYEPPKLKINF
jgi:hypothetical protein